MQKKYKKETKQLSVSTYNYIKTNDEDNVIVIDVQATSVLSSLVFHTCENHKVDWKHKIVNEMKKT